MLVAYCTLAPLDCAASAAAAPPGTVWLVTVSPTPSDSTSTPPCEQHSTRKGPRGRGSTAHLMCWAKKHSTLVVL
jgi:hypothetical protein